MTSTRTLARVLLQPVLIAATAALLLRGAVQTYSIPSGSMSPTLEAGDHIFVTPFNALLFGGVPERGDVVVFRSPFVEGEFFVKRIIALPGDEVELRHDRVIVNGRELREPWLASSMSNGERQPEILPDGYYFVMGDARANSIDSRSWGLLPADHIEGKARFIFWSAGGELAETANAAVFDSGRARETKLRWDRMFERIR